ncbi:unnamed protein product [Blepharisma stoltei]|uniref:Uncharacterized protein n=1 Tax=Blepharisma stoltei TaxID=1481888 RepID=A0AAU9JUG4_9CILI|nr:unnamed protein product [Blepharisma stoltei]
MSLTYQSEHLAWQQRVKQEQSRSYQFYNTLGTFSTRDFDLYRPLFPNGNDYSNSNIYKTFNEKNKSINHALTDRTLNRTPSFSPQKSLVRIRKSVSSSPKKMRRNLSSPIKPKDIKKVIGENQSHGDLNKLLINNKAKAKKSDLAAQIYIKELEERLKKERMKRINTEIKLTRMKSN